MPKATSASSRSSVPTAPLLGTVLVVAVVLVLGALVPSGEPSRGIDALKIFFVAGWPAGAWLLAGLGLGMGLVRVLPGIPHSPMRGPLRSIPIAWPLGIALLLIIDTALGSLGLMGRDRGVIAWIIILIAAVPGGIVLFRSLGSRSWNGPLMPGLALSIPIGVLLVAAVSTPGWLWASEFGGYDALSYHLQLPREWWHAGGIVETPHNAYGYLPGAVSAAFLHLMTLTGDPDSTGVSCQLLVAGITLVAALATGELAVLMLGRDVVGARLLAMISLLATPWVLVTGSLAYDEAVVMLLTVATASWLIRASREWKEIPDSVTGGMVGILLGAAVLAKASSGILVVIPLAVTAAILIRPGRWPRIMLATAVVGSAACLPWLIRNAAWTGNPVFPFAGDLFGIGDWTQEQIRRFGEAHRSDRGITGNLIVLFREFLLEGLVDGPTSEETLRPQWMWLPVIGLGSLGWMMIMHRPGRRTMVAMAVAVLVMIFAWMIGTHGKARFLLPTAPLLAAGVGAALAPASAWRSGRIAIGILAGGAVLGPITIYAGEQQGNPARAIDGRRAFDGSLMAETIRSSDPATSAMLRRDASRAFVLSELPSRSRVLMLGVADPWHLSWDPNEAAIEYSTVWTRGPIERSWASISEETDPLDAAKIAIDDLRGRGFTHVLISPTMLEVWSRSGWLDPTLEPGRIRVLSSVEGTRVVHRFTDDGILLAIEETPTP